MIKRLVAGEDDGGAYFSEVIAVFLADLEQRMTAARQAAGSADGIALAANMHALRGSCGNFGARPMMALCLEIERRARASALDGIGQIIDALEGETARVREALEQQRAQLAGTDGGGDAKEAARE